MPRTDVACTGEADDRHARAHASLDASDGILNHDATLRGKPHRVGSKKKKVRRRLAMRDLGGAENVVAEERRKAGQVQRLRDAHRIRGRRDAARPFNLLQHGSDA